MQLVIEKGFRIPFLLEEETKMFYCSWSEESFLYS